MRIVREKLEIIAPPPSTTRLLGVSCAAVLSAKMYAPWKYDIDKENESDYEAYQNIWETADLSEERVFCIRKRDEYMQGHKECLGHGRKHTELELKHQQMKESMAQEIADLKRQLAAAHRTNDGATEQAPAKKRAKKSSAQRKGKTNATAVVSIRAKISVKDIAAGESTDEFAASASNDAERDDTERKGAASLSQTPIENEAPQDEAPEDEDPSFKCSATVSPEAPSRPRSTRAVASKRRCDTPLAQQVKRARQTKACKAPKAQRAKKHQQKKANDEPICGVCYKKGTQPNRLLRCKRAECGALYHQKCVPSPLTAAEEEEWLCPICSVPGTHGKFLRCTEEKEHFEEQEHSMPLSGSEPDELWVFVNKEKIVGNGPHLAKVNAGNRIDGLKYWYAHIIITVYRDGVNWKIMKQKGRHRSFEEIMKEGKYHSFDRRHMSMSEDTTRHVAHFAPVPPPAPSIGL
jgi:hypothetical protein